MAEVTQGTDGSWSVLKLLCVGHRFSPLKWIQKSQCIYQWDPNRVKVHRLPSSESTASPNLSQAALAAFPGWLCGQTLNKTYSHPSHRKCICLVNRSEENSGFLLYLLKENGHCLVMDVN